MGYTLNEHTTLSSWELGHRYDFFQPAMPSPPLHGVGQTTLLSSRKICAREHKGMTKKGLDGKWMRRQHVGPLDLTAESAVEVTGTIKPNYDGRWGQDVIGVSSRLGRGGSTGTPRPLPSEGKLRRRRASARSS